MPTPEELRAALRAKAKAAPETPAIGQQALDNGVSSGEPPAEERRIITRPARERPLRVLRHYGSEQDIHRTLPHSIEAEQGVLGSMIISPRMVIPLVRQKINEEFFYVPAHQTIYTLSCQLFEDEGMFDLVTLTQYLRDVGHLDAVGGAAAVTSLFTFVPTAANIAYYLEIVREKYLLRQIIAVSTENCRQAYEEQDEVNAFIVEAGQRFEVVKVLANSFSDDVERFGFPDLLAFDPKTDPDNLIGFRWLCRGFTCLWAGGAGFGKSTFSMQAAIYWGNGLPVFGMTPARRLKSLIIQSENDLGDTAEQFQGVIEGIKKSTQDFNPEACQAVIRENVIILRVLAKTGFAFCALLESLIQQHGPDLVWIDPLFAFAGCDLVDAAEAGRFLREGLIPIAVRNRVCLHVIHHTGKPVRDNDSKDKMSHHEFQYLGFGSSEIQNAFRAVNIILPVSGHEKTFRLILSKRGSRAGAKNPAGEFTSDIYLTHAEEGICWLQIAEPEKAQPRGTDSQFSKQYSGETILGEMSLMHGQRAGDLQKHMQAEAGMSSKTFYRLWADLKGEGNIKIDSDGKWLKK